MGQFKPMVKMETTEPSVTLHLKKGGSATFERMNKEGVPKMGDKAPVKKATGGVMGALARSSPMLNVPMGNPGAARALAAKRMMPRRSGPTQAQAPMMKEGGSADQAQDKAMVKKAMKQHDEQEHKGGPGTKLALKKGGVGKKPFATGGKVESGSPVKMAQGSKPSPGPVEITRLAGTYKRGGAIC